MRDFTYSHPTIAMVGPNPCVTCQHADGIGWCNLHKFEVSVFDGCAKHKAHPKMVSHKKVSVQP